MSLKSSQLTSSLKNVGMRSDPSIDQQKQQQSDQPSGETRLTVSSATFGIAGPTPPLRSYIKLDTREISAAEFSQRLKEGFKGGKAYNSSITGAFDFARVLYYMNS